MVAARQVLKKPVLGAWVQTDRSAHEAWIVLWDESPAAAKLMHLLVSRIGTQNSVVASQATLASLMGCSVRTVQRATEVLKSGRWVELRYVSSAGGVYAYVLNSRVVWTGPRSAIKYGFLDAALILRDVDQKDGIAAQSPLRPAPLLIDGHEIDPETGEVLSGPERVVVSADRQIGKLRGPKRSKRAKLRLVSPRAKIKPVK